MLLKPMRYKDYTWPHNPESCAVEYRRQIAAHKIPLGGWYLQDLGRTYRIFRGEGTFAGERAYEEFQTLAEVFDQTGPGLLVHPVWRTERAYFVSLSVTEEPRPASLEKTPRFMPQVSASFTPEPTIPPPTAFRPKAPLKIAVNTAPTWLIFAKKIIKAPMT